MELRNKAFEWLISIGLGCSIVAYERRLHKGPLWVLANLMGVNYLLHD